MPCPGQRGQEISVQGTAGQDKTTRSSARREEAIPSRVEVERSCIICVLLGRKAEPTARQLQACMAFCLNNNRQNSARCAVLWPYCGRTPLPTISPFTVQGRGYLIYLCTWLCTWPTRYLRMRCARNSLSIPCHKAQQACCIGEPIFVLSSDFPRDCP